MAKPKNPYAKSFRKVFEEVMTTGEPLVLLEAFEKVMTTGEPRNLYEEFEKILDNVIERKPKEECDEAALRVAERVKETLRRMAKKPKDLLM